MGKFRRLLMGADPDLFVESKDNFKLKNKHNFNINEIKKPQSKREDDLYVFWFKISNESEYKFLVKEFKKITKFDKYNKNKSYILVDDGTDTINYSDESYKKFCKDTKTNFEVFEVIGEETEDTKKMNSKIITVSMEASSTMGISDEFEDYISFAKHVNMVINDNTHDSNFKNEENAIRYLITKFDDYDFSFWDEVEEK